MLMLANILVTGLSLIRTPAITWLMPKEEVGMIGVLTAWIPFVHLLSFPGIDTASYHYIAKGHPWAFAYGVAHRLRWSLLSFLGFCAGALYWHAQGNPPLAWMFIITALAYPVTVGLNIAGNTLAALENFTGLFWYRIAQSLTNFVGFIPLLLSTLWLNRALTFYTANQLVTAIIQVSLTWFLWQRLRQMPTARATPDEKAEMLRYGKHQTAISSISVVRAQADSFLVSAFFPLTVIADYTLAVLAQSQMKQLWTIFVSVRYPSLVRMSVGSRWRRFIYEGAVITVGFIALGIVLGLAARWLIPLLLPVSYVQSLPYIYWSIATFVFNLPGYLTEAYFRTEQDEHRQYTMQSIAAVLGVALPLMLLFKWQIQGLLFGRLLASFGFSCVGIWLFIKAKPQIITKVV